MKKSLTMIFGAAILTFSLSGCMNNGEPVSVLPEKESIPQVDTSGVSAQADRTRQDIDVIESTVNSILEAFNGPN